MESEIWNLASENWNMKSEIWNLHGPIVSRYFLIHLVLSCFAVFAPDLTRSLSLSLSRSFSIRVGLSRLVPFFLSSASLSFFSSRFVSFCSVRARFVSLFLRLSLSFVLSLDLSCLVPFFPVSSHSFSVCAVLCRRVSVFLVPSPSFSFYLIAVACSPLAVLGLRWTKLWFLILDVCLLVCESEGAALSFLCCCQAFEWVYIFAIGCWPYRLCAWGGQL